MKPINEKLAADLMEAGRQEFLTHGFLGASMQSITPAVLLPILPVGLLLRSGGSLSAAHFLTIIVLSLGLTSPLIAACPSWMSLLW